MGQSESIASEPSRRHSNDRKTQRDKLSAVSACPSNGNSDSSTPNAPSPECLLTQRQKIALQKSWKKSPRTGIDNIGSQIFMKIYMRDRSVGKIFGMEKLPLRELKYHKFFQIHAATFIKSIDFIVMNCDNIGILRSYCRHLGKGHTKYIKRGFKMEYWDIFAEALTECAISWEGGIRCRDILVGWRKLINFVIEEMRVTFLKTKRERFLKSTPSDDDLNPDNLNIDGMSLICSASKGMTMESCSSPVNTKLRTSSSLSKKSNLSASSVADFHINHPENVDVYAAYNSPEHTSDQGYTNRYINNWRSTHGHGNISMVQKQSYTQRQKFNNVPDAQTTSYTHREPMNSYRMEKNCQRGEEYEPTSFQKYDVVNGSSESRRTSSLQPRNYVSDLI